MKNQQTILNELTALKEDDSFPLTGAVIQGIAPTLTEELNRIWKIGNDNKLDFIFYTRDYGDGSALIILEELLVANVTDHVIFALLNVWQNGQPTDYSPALVELSSLVDDCQYPFLTTFQMSHLQEKCPQVFSLMEELLGPVTDEEASFLYNKNSMLTPLQIVDLINAITSCQIKRSSIPMELHMEKLAKEFNKNS